MLDRENTVVSAETEIGDDVAPIGLSVAVSNGTEYPRAVDLVAVMLGIKHAVFRLVVCVYLCILCMNVIDRSLKLTDSSYGIHTLPDEVRGVEVCADDIAYRCAELEEGLGIVNTEAGVHLKRYANAVSLAELAVFFQ